MKHKKHMNKLINIQNKMYINKLSAHDDVNNTDISIMTTPLKCSHKYEQCSSETDSQSIKLIGSDNLNRIL